MVQRRISVAAAAKAASTVCAWLIAAAPLAGCGQKGPLVLVKPASAAAAPAAAASSP